MNKMNEITIEAYKTNLGYFFKVRRWNNYYEDIKTWVSSIAGVPVEEIQKVHNTYWYLLKEEPSTAKRKGEKKYETISYKLKDDRLAGTFASTVPASEVELKWNDDDDDVEAKQIFAGKHKGLDDYYEAVKGEVIVPDVDVKVNLQIIRELDIENYNAPTAMKVSYNEGNFGGKTTEVDLSKLARFEDFEEFLTPEFLMHTRPCSLTSTQVYKIVREHVKRNISTKHAFIDSDYDFCFSVSKRVKTQAFEVITEQTTKNGRRYKTPKFTKTMQDTRNAVVFRMTHSTADKGGGWKDYPVIESWTASSLQELYNQIQYYLEDLMKIINAPTEDCVHCAGKGMYFEKIETNARD